MADDFAGLKSRVADELNRSDLTSQISSAVLRAIEFYANERFTFVESETARDTEADNQYVTLPSDLREEDRVYTTVGGYQYDLTKQEFETLEYWHGASNTKGQPLDYARRDGRLRIWPTPNAVYTLTILGKFDQTALNEDTDTNGWTSGLPADLIVARAKFTISRGITYDQEAAAAAGAEVKETLARLRQEAGDIITDNKVEAGW